MEWSNLEGHPLSTLAQQQEAIMRWVESEPQVTMITLGQIDLLNIRKMRQGREFVETVKSTIRDLIQEGKNYIQSRDGLIEYEYRMMFGHKFILATPRRLEKIVVQLKVHEYENIKGDVTKALIDSRKDLFTENILVVETGVDLAGEIRRSVAKLICTRCQPNYIFWNIYAKYFNHAGCDDPRGASMLKDKIEEGEE